MNESLRVGRNTAYLTAAQLFSQVSSAFYVAVLARYVLAEGMGKLATAQAVTSIAFVFVNLGLDTLIVRDVAQDRTRTLSYLSGSLWLKVGLSVLACALLVVFSGAVGYTPDTRLILYLYAVGTALRCFSNSVISIWQAHESMRPVALVRVLRDAVNVVGSLLAIALGASLVIIVCVSVLANVVELVATLVIKPVQLRFDPRVSLTFLKVLLLRNVPFAGLAIISVSYAQAAIVILSVQLDQASVGYYSSAQILLGFVFILPAMLSQALLPTLSRLNMTAPARLGETYANAFRLTWVVGSFLAVITFFLAQPLVRVVFGGKYDDSIPVFRLIALTLFVSSNWVSGSLLVAINRQSLFTISQVVFLVLQLILVLILVPTLGILGASVAFVLPSLFGFVYYSAICHRLLGLAFPWGLARGLGISVCLTAVALLASNAVGLPWWISGLVVALPIFWGLSFLLRILAPAEAAVIIRSLLPRELWALTLRILPSSWSSWLRSV